MTAEPDRRLERYALLSVAAALATITLKLLAWWLTDSVGLLSDALESFVNLGAALLALWMIRLAARPPDEAHPFGRTKAEYFASGAEGALIVLAAISIVYAALPRLVAPQPIQAAAAGVVIALIASVINFGAARVLMKAATTYHSIALEADAKHLMTDVWTSVGVVIGVGLVAATDWLRLDPLIALAVAANILWTGGQLIKRSVAGLLDAAISPDEQADVQKILDEYAPRYGIEFHALRSRRGGARRFVYFHMLVPEAWTVAHAHRISDEIEERIRSLVPNAVTFVHIEPIGHPSSYDDEML